MGQFTLFLFTLVMIAPTMGESRAKISNLEEIRRSLNWSSRSPLATPARPLRLAIIDKGLNGVSEEIGKTLPSDTTVFAGPVTTPENEKSEHGLRMGQIVTALITDDLRHPERLRLSFYNSFGFSNFQAAITQAISDQVDMVLYAEVWEYGGNFDGRGFINAEIDRAVDAGILWINAAGNFGRTTYNGEVKTGAENWVDLPDTNRSIRVLCKAPAQSRCPLRAVLTWNDFKDSTEPGTEKDLDLALTDDLLNIRRTGTLRQSADPTEGRPGFSKYPREIVVDELPPGTYFLRVKDISGNFGPEDRLRLTVDGDFLEMPSADTDENMATAADHPRAITVGASDSDRSSRSLRRAKPEVLAPSSIKLDDGTEFRGSSNAAAITTAVASLSFLRRGSLSRETFFSLHTESQDWSQRGLSLSWLRFSFTGQNCFIEGSWPEAPAYLSPALRAGGRFVETTSGWRIMTPFDPISLMGGWPRQRPDDMITLGPNGWRLFPRTARIPDGAVEVFQRPAEVGLCRSTRAPFERPLR